MQPDTWYAIHALTGWLNSTNELTPHELTLRIMKIGEEFGEVVNAHIGTIGQNPRKGTYATRSDVAKELCDVIVTAMVALNSMTGNVDETRDIFGSHLAGLLSRVDQMNGFAGLSRDG
ncbi:MazG-like family protein [Actinomadura sp. 9N215]|uniref:MazG-like family protein n=1 Tax=Actinomadura sp. 9N215 TaxID=3375150 RepID=UPI0037896241